MSREAAYVALFAKLQTLSGTFKLIDRRLRTLEELPQPNFPALFMTVAPQKVVAKPGVPPRVTLGASIFIFVSGNATAASGIVLNNLIDLVTTTLAPSPSPFTPQQTLGGLVAHAWIEGTIDVFEAIKTQRAAALIPITMLMP
jgi:hypothetical protein